MQWLLRSSLFLEHSTRLLSYNAPQVLNKGVRYKGSSTPAWLNRQRRDPFVKARGNYRSRSAFKLLQMNEQFQIYPVVGTVDSSRFLVADLGCSPGGWSQASLELLGKPLGDLYNEDVLSDDEDIPIPQVVGVDIIATEPLPGARFIQGDFLDPSVQYQIQDIFGGQDTKLDLILSDMAPNLSGNRIADIEASLELCRSVLEFAKRNLRRTPGKSSKSGTLIFKHFAAPEVDEFRQRELAPFFSQKIKYTKPEASRQKSSEAYFVCQGFKG